ncbi:MAG: LysE family transporter [Pseudomonadota bacterium]
MDILQLGLILGMAFISTASPGPATLALAHTAARDGRRTALTMAAGIVLGSLTWSVGAAFGLGAVFAVSPWLTDAIRIAGACYLIWLGIQAAKAALRPASAGPATPQVAAAFRRGLTLHLTNPKAILFFTSLYAVGVPADATTLTLLTVITAVGLQSAFIFGAYAFVFSVPAVGRAYGKAQRPLNAVLAVVFTAVGTRLIMSSGRATG